MKVILIAQHGDTVPRVTHHDDIMMARMELGTWMATGAYSEQPVVICVDLSKVPEIEVNVSVAIQGGFYSCIELKETRPYAVAIHLWGGDSKDHTFKLVGHPSKESAYSHLEDCLAFDEQKAYLHEFDHICFVNPEGRHVDLFIVDLLNPSETMF